MSRLFYHTMQDNAGNLLFDVSGTMRVAGTSTVATIYGDEAMTVILPNPMTNHPSFGSFKCYLPVGDYDFYMAKAGYTFETLTGLQGYGTLAEQNADAVSVTRIGIGVPANPLYALDCIGPSQLQGTVGLGATSATQLTVIGQTQLNGALNSTAGPNTLQGAVGLGNTTATSMQVMGTTTLNGALNNTAGPNTLQGEVGLGNTTAVNMTVTGSTVLQGSLNNTAGPSTLQGAVGLGNTTATSMQVMGTTTLNGALNSTAGPNTLQGAVGLGNTTATSMQVTGGTTLSGGTTTSNLLATNLTVTTAAELLGRATVGNTMALNTSATLKIDYLKNTYHGITLRPSDSDAGIASPILFNNTGDSTVGSIQTTSSATSYNTSSDARLKTAVEALTGGLDVIRGLNPVSFLWKLDDTRGQGFLASEVEDVVPGVVSGARDAVDDAGQIVPQQIDLSKLVPWLVSAVKELTMQVETLTAKLAATGA